MQIAYTEVGMPERQVTITLSEKVARSVLGGVVGLRSNYHGRADRSGCGCSWCEAEKALRTVLKPEGEKQSNLSVPDPQGKDQAGTFQSAEGEKQ